MNSIICITAASAALLTTLVYGPAVAQTVERPTLAADQCQPLTQANFELCCVAQNREVLLTGGEVDQCPPLTTALIQKVIDDMEDSDNDNGLDGGTTGGVVPGDGAGVGVDPDGGATGGETQGNPGNLKDAGNAGEAPSGGSGEGFGSGNDDKGKSN